MDIVDRINYFGRDAKSEKNLELMFFYFPAVKYTFEKKVENIF